VRLALDEQIFAIQRYGGISRMFAELAHQFSVHAAEGVTLAPLAAPVVNRYILDDPQLSIALHAHEARNEWTALARYFSRLRSTKYIDVVHNTFYLPHGLASTKGAKRVVTVHDMIPEMMPQTRRRLDWLTLKRRYVETADLVICVSESTRDDLTRIYGNIKAPIRVVHHGVADRFHPGAQRLDFLPERYVLFVGNRGPYKDADVLFQAFAEVASDHDDLQLLCVGGSGLSASEVARLDALGIRSKVSQRFLPDDQMVSAYAHAEVYVLPSRFEGFGLPALEAMATGTPVLLARATSLPEVGGDAAAYFSPSDPRDLADQLRTLVEGADLRERMSKAGVKHAAGFTWASTAQETAAAYREITG
jgi:glycosyltransferase involved in cell wall biosynthesis